MPSIAKLPQIHWLPAGTEPLSRFQLWYYQNQDTLSAKRKQKYRTDPDYREKILLRQRSYRRVTNKKKFFKIAFNGKLYKVFSRQYAFCFIGTFVDSIRYWEKKSLIPFCIFPAKKRYYTAVQLQLLHEFGGLMKAQEVNPKSAVIAALLKQQTAKMFHCWYDGSLQDDGNTE